MGRLKLSGLLLLLLAMSCGGPRNPGTNPPPGTDNSNPVITFVSVNEGATVSGTVAVTATATDNVGVTAFSLAINGTQAADSADGNLAFSWDTTTLADGAAVLVFTARDAVGNTATQTVNATVNNVPGGTVATVSGVIRAPNGVDPVAGALVFARAAGASAVGDPPDEPHHAFTYSAADGSFSLAEVPTGQQSFKIVKGPFSKEFNLDVQAGVNELPAVQTTLPTQSGDGANVGKILVVTGDFDVIQNVLAKLGLGTADAAGSLEPGSELFDLVDGNGTLGEGYPDFLPFFSDPANYAEHRTIFLNCGIADTDQFFENETAVAGLKSWVEAGGRLYCTDWSYDFIEQLWPHRVDFAGFAADGDGLLLTPEPLGGALAGQMMEELPATAQDAGLSAWMQAMGAADGDGVFPTVDWLPGWVPIDNVADGVKVWVTGEVGHSGHDGEARERPLTVTFSAGTGTVLFSSYHTELTPEPELLPQERLLQYLIFEVL